MSGTGSYQAEAEGRDVDSEIERLQRQTMLSWAEEERLLTRCGIGGGPLRVLELGCGPGYVTQQLLRWLPEASITAVDIDAAMIGRAARTIGDQAQPRVTFVHGSSAAVDRPDGSFDFVIARYLFQHLPDPSLTVVEALRLLAPGGRLAVIDVDAELWGLAQPVFREVMPIYAKTGRFQAQRGGNRLIGRTLWRTLRDAGFADVELDAFVYHSDALGLEPFAPQLAPDRLLPMVRAGVITADEFAIVQRAYERFMANPDSYVLMVGLMAPRPEIVTGEAPAPITVTPPADPAATRLALRRAVLIAAGAADAILDECLAYGDSPYRLASVRSTWPLAEEAHVAAWRRYANSGTTIWEALRQRLPQLRFPIREGISKSDAYGQTIRRGMPFDEAATGGEVLTLREPDGLRLEIHDHPAGALPVLLPSGREDFETLFRALACQSEPVPVGPAVNAQMIAGLVNWDRVAAYRQAWSETAAAEERPWPAELARVAAQAPQTFYDRVILLGRGPYSGLPPERLGLTLDTQGWLDRSNGLRLEHEFTHYTTKRLFGTMRLNLFDELLADGMGMSYALGAFRASWFLSGLGLDDLRAIDPRGRVHTYRGGLSDAAFAVTCALLVKAARRVEVLAARFYTIETRGRFLLAVADLSIELLASDLADTLFDDSYARAGQVGTGSSDSGLAAAEEGRS